MHSFAVFWHLPCMNMWHSFSFLRSRSSLHFLFRSCLSSLSHLRCSRSRLRLVGDTLPELDPDLDLDLDSELPDSSSSASSSSQSKPIFSSKAFSFRRTSRFWINNKNIINIYSTYTLTHTFLSSSFNSFLSLSLLLRL